MANEKEYPKYDLEKYFEKYPDCPKEVILKEDVMRFGVVFSEAALENQEGFATKTYYIFSYDKADKKGEGFKAPECWKFSGGPYDLRKTNNKSIMADEDRTPYKIDKIDGKIQLFWEGNYIADIEFPPRPSWYDNKLKDGTPYSDVVANVFWGYLPLTVPLRSCQYWGTKEECHFCDINATAKKMSKTGKPHMIYKSVDDVAEVIECIFTKDRVVNNHSMLMSGGSIRTQVHGKANVEFYASYVREIRKRIGYRWPIHVQTTALTKKECKELKDSGVTCHHANIEIWDKRLFEIYCPAKNKYIGRDEWVKRVVESVDVFGEGNVVPTFVSGCEMARPNGFTDVDEAVNKMREGLDYLMSNGVTPRLSSWTIEPRSVLGKIEQPPVPLEYYIGVDMAWNEIWKKHMLPPITGFTPMGPGRCLGINSAHLDIAP